MALLAAVRAPWQVLALRALLGFFAGYGPIAMTMAAESAPPEHMATAIGWVQTAQRLGPALGPVHRRTARGQRRAPPDVSRRGACCTSARSCSCSSAIARKACARRAAPGRAASPPTWAAVRALPHFVLCSRHRSSACSSPIAASARCCRCTWARSAPPPDHVAVRERLAVHDHGRRRRARQPSPGGQAAEEMASVASRRAGGRRGVAWRGRIRRSGRRHRCSSRRPWSSAWASASRRRRSTRRRGERAPVSDRGVAFGYLTTAYLIALAVSPVVAGLIGAQSMRAVFFLDAVGLAAIAVIVRRRIP